jgi:predicted AlkP superfamily phosphohydrolase/phosphomutase
LTKKKKKTIKENNEEYIEHLHQIIRTQKKRIHQLEKDENYDLIGFRKKLVDKVGFLTDNYHNLEILINKLAI